MQASIRDFRCRRPGSNTTMLICRFCGFAAFRKTFNKNHPRSCLRGTEVEPIPPKSVNELQDDDDDDISAFRFSETTCSNHQVCKLEDEESVSSKNGQIPISRTKRSRANTETSKTGLARATLRKKPISETLELDSYDEPVGNDVDSTRSFEADEMRASDDKFFVEDVYSISETSANASHREQNESNDEDYVSQFPQSNGVDESTDALTLQSLSCWKDVVRNYRFQRTPPPITLRSSLSGSIENALVAQQDSFKPSTALSKRLELFHRHASGILHIPPPEIANQTLPSLDNRVIQVFCDMYLGYLTLPDFQRCGSTWDLPDRQDWLKTLLFNQSLDRANIELYREPLSSRTTRSHPSLSYHVMDGYHRLSTIRDFILGRLSYVIHLPSIDKDGSSKFKVRAVRYSFLEIPREYQDMFLQHTLKIVRSIFDSSTANAAFCGVNSGRRLKNPQILWCRGSPFVRFVTNDRGKMPVGTYLSFRVDDFAQRMADRLVANKTPIRFPVKYHTDYAPSSNAFEKFFLHYVNLAAVAYSLRPSMAGSFPMVQNFVNTTEIDFDINRDSALARMTRCLEFFYRLLGVEKLSFEGHSAEFYSLELLFLECETDFADLDTSPNLLAEWYMVSFAAFRTEPRRTQRLNSYFNCVNHVRCNSDVDLIRQRKQILIDSWREFRANSILDQPLAPSESDP